MVDEVDDSVVVRAKSGDQRAFAELVRHYDHRLRALAFRLLHSRDAMDDALQDAYVKAFRALPGFRTGAAPGTWLYRIVYNTCLDELRRQRRRPAEPFDDGDLEQVVDATGHGPDAAMVGSPSLESALADLPPDQRAALLLVDAEGYDYAAAAEVLGVQPGTIGSRVSRARAAVRAALTSIDDNAEDDR